MVRRYHRRPTRSTVGVPLYQDRMKWSFSFFGFGGGSGCSTRTPPRPSRIIHDRSAYDPELLLHNILWSYAFRNVVTTFPECYRESEWKTNRYATFSSFNNFYCRVVEKCIQLSNNCGKRYRQNNLFDRFDNISSIIQHWYENWKYDVKTQIQISIYQYSVISNYLWCIILTFWNRCLVRWSVMNKKRHPSQTA